MRRYGYLFIIISICVLSSIFVISNSYALPEETTITNAKSELDVAKLSSPSSDTSFYTVNTTTGKTSDGTFTDLGEGTSYKKIVKGADNSSEKMDLVKNYLLDSGLYVVNEESSSKLEVVAIYSNKRVRVDTKDKDINTYGAVSGVFYKDYYLLSYDTEEDTKLAYENLVKDYGKDKIMLDLPVKSDSAMGWGFSYMKFNTKFINASLYENNPVIVAVLDSGINKDHEIFSDTSILDGANMIDSTKTIMDDDGHGTAVSGIIAETTTHNVSILPVKVLDEDGNGSLNDIFNGLEWAEKKGARIANLSFGVDYRRYLHSSQYIQEIEDTIKNYEAKMAERDLLMISASGNEHSNADRIYSFPGISKYTISVGSINESETISGFSNYGNSLDFVAPGESLVLANYASSTGYSTLSGTSFSAPYVVSAASMVLSEYPNYSNDTIKNYLISISKDLGDTGKDIYYGYGVPIFKDDSSFTDDNFIENYTLVLDKTSYVYDGKYKRPKVTIKDKNNNILNSKYYDVIYSNNLNAGTGVVTVTGKNNYYGAIAKTFSISRDNIAGAKVQFDKKKYSYTGKKIKPSVVVDKSNRGLATSDYSISYKNNKKIGLGTLILTGKGNYSGTKTVTFKIVPKKVTISSIKGKKKRVVVKWKKASPSPTSYEVKYKKSNSSKWKTIITNNRSITIKKLKKRTSYNVKVRAYKIVNGKAYKGSYSKTYVVTTS